MLITIQPENPMLSPVRFLHAWCLNAYVTKWPLLVVTQIVYLIRSQQNNLTAHTACRLANFGLTGWNIPWIDIWRMFSSWTKIWMHVSFIQFHMKISSTWRRPLKDKWTSIHVFELRLRRLATVALVTFFEYGLSTPVERFNDRQNTDELEYKYSVNELLFYLTNDIMLIREKDKDAHCPILITIEPNEMTNQQKKSFVTNETKQQRAASREEIQKANKAKGKARASNWSILFTREDNFKRYGLSTMQCLLENDE